MTAPLLPIAAIATAPGRGGIGVVRVSGPDVVSIARAVCGQTLKPRHATYLPFLDARGGVIDHGLALYFPAPHSYTGEEVLELQGHGGPVVMQMLLARCLEAGRDIGLRLAEPGEFTRRAFLNDKLDLAQAEAVADLIEASTEAAARSAARSMEGVFSQAIHTLVEKVIHLRMLVEATLDFPEEEIDFLEASDARGQLAAIRESLKGVLKQAKQGALLREGLSVVLAGQPNVGKSSLLNALAGAELAIVTPIAGTTRDRVRETIQIEGIPLHIIDTAGLREDAADEVERIGIERTWEAIGRADVVLHLVDATDYLENGLSEIDDAIDDRLSGHLPPGSPIVRVVNKIDTAPAASDTMFGGNRPHVVAANGPNPTEIWISARTGAGIDLMRRELLRIVGWQSGSEGTFLARERHLTALRCAQSHLDCAAERADQQAQALDLFAEELRLAQEHLNSITGEFTSDDLLGTIFTRFCIGK
ncbi:tRNA uridine-5-carboxymethylaminomethyl(34) synthesis GTPase MnmE [Cupriavidus plantarum]|uniref:tRNA modification GTPase MnmE n=1 Tax=Cupriavidus plantarum TaxID=942865 RepID=A0A316F4C1_9BURK|nr:tRNA uridine-5-carboxymethylaminomethyl(34) synthesis GTPase MnmE [Cupriavidus plantarum]PWK38925.1 tRNA modification GTPase trmE [Cupriavidus plantarum]CAG2150499.1 tRNA modification GTPase MnmE [Cupriavidus plantarum]SMR67921.1 tRNA modification GTPase trmE [Cupriavidus plantarum]